MFQAGRFFALLGVFLGVKSLQMPYLKDSSYAYGPKGREFESSTARTYKKPRKSSIYAVSGVFLCPELWAVFCGK